MQRVVMTHCIEADRAELQGVFDSMAYFREIEGLQQTQHLNILAAAMLLEPGFEQTPQFGEAVRQLPTGEWSRLVQSPRLLFEQRQIVQRIEDYRLAFIAALVSCDDLAGAGNHPFVNEALHQNLTVSVLDRKSVVVATIANQRQRSNSHRDLLAGFVRSCGQRQHRSAVALEALADGLRVPTQPPLAPLAALHFKMRVELLPTVEVRYRNHEVASGIADQALDLALVIAFSRSPELIREEIVALQLGEGLRLLPFLATQNLRYRDPGVVVENPRRNAAEVGEGSHMAFQKGLCRFGRKRHDETIIRMGQVHRQIVRLLLNASDHDHGFAEVRLRLARWMRQRHKHLLTAQRRRAHVVLHDGVATGELMLLF